MTGVRQRKDLRFRNMSQDAAIWNQGGVVTMWHREIIVWPYVSVLVGIGNEDTWSQQQTRSAFDRARGECPSSKRLRLRMRTRCKEMKSLNVTDSE